MDPPDTFLETGTVWTVWKSLNRTFLCQEKKKKSLVKFTGFCGGKRRLWWDFMQGKCPLVSQYESLYLPEFLPYLLRPLVLPFKLHFPLGPGCISCGMLLCCPIWWSVLKLFVWFYKLLLNDLIQIARLVLFGLIMLKMLFARVFRFFSFLPSSRNSGISWGTGIEFFYQTYRACCDRRCCKRRQNWPVQMFFLWKQLHFLYLN